MNNDENTTINNASNNDNTSTDTEQRGLRYFLKYDPKTFQTMFFIIQNNDGYVTQLRDHYTYIRCKMYEITRNDYIKGVKSKQIINNILAKYEK